MRTLISYGWGTWIRTKEMPDSESGALPLGYTPISIGNDNILLIKACFVNTIFKIFYLFCKDFLLFIELTKIW